MVMCGQALEPAALPTVWAHEPVPPRPRDSGDARPCGAASWPLVSGCRASAQPRSLPRPLLPAPFSTPSLDTSHRSSLLLRCPLREAFLPAQSK